MKTYVTAAIFALIFIPGVLSAQSWNIEWEQNLKKSNFDTFTDVVEGTDGMVTILGSTIPPGKADMDIWLVRMNAAGQLLWAKTYGTENNDYPSRLMLLPDNTSICTGKIENGKEVFKAFILKTDESGNEVWKKEFDAGTGCFFDDIALAENQNFIVAGTKKQDVNSQVIWLIKFDPTGEIIWEKTFGEGNIACSKSLKSLPDGSFILAGQITSAGETNSKIWLLRFNENGDAIWDNKLRSDGRNEWPECVCCSPDNNLMVVGWSGKSMDDNDAENAVFDFDLLITKISPEGKVVWTSNIDSEGSEGGNAIAIRPDGKILLAGKKETSFLGRIGSWLLLADENGKILSENVMPYRFGKDQAARIINSTDGGFIVIGPGKIDAQNGNIEAWIKKYKPVM